MRSVTAAASVDSGWLVSLIKYFHFSVACYFLKVYHILFTNQKATAKMVTLDEAARGGPLAAAAAAGPAVRSLRCPSLVIFLQVIFQVCSNEHSLFCGEQIQTRCLPTITWFFLKHSVLLSQLHLNCRMLMAIVLELRFVLKKCS